MTLGLLHLIEKIRLANVYRYFGWPETIHSGHHGGLLTAEFNLHSEFLVPHSLEKRFHLILSHCLQAYESSGMQCYPSCLFKFFCGMTN